MSQTYHDQMAKQLFQKFLGAFGEVELSREVPGEARFIDIYFSPYTDSEADPTPLGLLGRLAEHPCLIEPYRNPPSPADMESCLLKLMWILAEQRREAKREPKPLPKLLLSWLWILTPTGSEAFMQRWGLKGREDWLPGVYFSIGGLRLGIIVIHHLPKTEETLWLRLLGKGSVQQQAIRAVLELPAADPRRQAALQLLTSWRMIMMESGEAEEEELMTVLSQAYAEWEQKTLQIGEERRTEQIACNMLAAGMDPAQISQLTELAPERIRQLQAEQIRED